jgi:hypothetical protein
VSTLPSPLHVPVTPHPTDVLLFATVENGVAIVNMADADVPACPPMPHGDCLVVGFGPCCDWSCCCDYVLHVFSLFRSCEYVFYLIRQPPSSLGGASLALTVVDRGRHGLVFPSLLTSLELSHHVSCCSETLLPQLLLCLCHLCFLVVLLFLILVIR